LSEFRRSFSAIFSRDHRDRIGENARIHAAHANIKSSRCSRIWRIFIVSYEQALDQLSRDDRFKATVYAMNTLLIHKGIYTQKEFEQLFIEWASKQSKISTQEIGREARASV
jgi:hypothetical protein